MPTVLEVIQLLEVARITKEQLETTRLAKHINQLRRSVTLNGQLARRLKNLIKRWREMIHLPPLTTTTTTAAATTNTSKVIIRPNGGLSGTTTATTTVPPQPTSFTNFIGQAERAAAAATIKRQTPVGSVGLFHIHHHHNDDRSMSPLPPKMPRCDMRSTSPFDAPHGIGGNGGDGGGAVSTAIFADDSNSRRLFNGSMYAIASTDSNSFPVSDNQSSNFVGGGSMGSAAAIKHKKHKKDKKKSRSERKQYVKLSPMSSISVPVHLQQQTIAVQQTTKYEPPNSLSSDSNTLFAAASGATSSIFSSELTFTGKFAKESTLPVLVEPQQHHQQLPPPSAIISIDSSSNEDEEEMEVSNKS